MNSRPILAVLASLTVILSGATQAFAVADKEELEKARESMKCGKCSESFDRLHKMASGGHSTAECLVGMCYQHGRGVKKDSKQAKYWYERSAEHGFPDAQNQLGKMYLNGDEIEKDTVKAEHWLGKAAKSNIAEAQYNLGKLYVKENNAYNKNINSRLLMARRWILLARDHGVEDTEKLLDQIPGYEKAESAVTTRIKQSRTNTAQGMSNIQNSWTGYADMVSTLRDINSTASQ